MSSKEQLKKIERQSANRKKNRTIALKAKLFFVLILIVLVIASIIITTSGEKIVTAMSVAFEDNKLASGEESETVNMVKSSDGEMVPVPKGYSASQIEGETSVDGGFVIYEGDIDWRPILDGSAASSLIATANEQAKQTANQAVEQKDVQQEMNNPINTENIKEEAEQGDLINEEKNKIELETEKINNEENESVIDESTEEVDNEANIDAGQAQNENEETPKTAIVAETPEIATYAETENAYSITKDGTTAYYNTLAEAYEAASSGDTIKLEADTTESTEITIAKDIHLDTGTHTLTTNTITIGTETTLYIEGTGKIINTGNVHTITNNGTLELNTNATIENLVTSSGYSAVNNSGTLNIADGTITATYQGIRQYNTSGITNMSGGNVIATEMSSAYGIYNYSTSSSYRPTVRITGGTVMGKAMGIYHRGSNAYTYIGNNEESEVNSEAPIISGGSNGVYRYDYQGYVYFYNGILKGTTAGYNYGPNNIRSGYKIAEGTETIDGTTYKTAYLEKVKESVTEQEIAIFNLQKTTNQYVWVPVEDITQIYGMNENGKLLGKLYSKFGKKERNNSSRTNWSETNGIMSWSSTTNYREPDILTYSGYDTDRGLANYLSGETEGEYLAKEMEENFCKMIKSIKKYGGFYIGRYETGGLSDSDRQKAVVRKMREDIASTRWYSMYEACKNLSGTNENVTTSMIWGCLWDETLNWLVNKQATNQAGDELDNKKVASDSTSWGNYYDAGFNYIDTASSKENKPIETTYKGISSSKVIPSGSTEYTKVNNIYDMAGNVYDWSLEADSSYSRVLRGGYYNISGNSRPASYRLSNYPNVSSYNYGCRGVLLIN